MKPSRRRLLPFVASAVAGAAFLSLPLTLRAEDKPPLDKATVGEILNGAKGRLGKCAALGEGTVTVVFRIGESGHVEDLRVDPPHHDQPIGKCVGGIIRGLEFPENDGTTPPITYPVRLKSKDKDKLRERAGAIGGGWVGSPR